MSAFVLIPINGYCSGLVAFVGQNWGAGLIDRVRSARNLGYGFGLIWGAITAMAIAFFAPRIAVIFSTDPEVVSEIVRYLRIVPFGYALVGVFNVTEETLNAVGRPVLASAQTFVHTFALAIPLAVYGGKIGGLDGLLMGLVAADWGGALFGVAASIWSCRACFLESTEVEVAQAAT